MALIDCPECNHSVSDKAIACPKCGFPIKVEPKLSDEELTSQPSTEIYIAKKSTDKVSNSETEKQLIENQNLWSDGSKTTNFYSHKILKFLHEKIIRSNGNPHLKTTLVRGSILIVVILIIIINSLKFQLTESDKVKLCKSYIGAIFSKSTQIISLDAVQGDLVRVHYIRPFDNTKWGYKCRVTNNSIVWASWFDDTQKWGRWRDEEETEFEINEQYNQVIFTIKEIDKRVVVQLER